MQYLLHLVAYHQARPAHHFSKVAIFERLDEDQLEEYANTTLELMKIVDTDNHPEFSGYISVQVLGFSKFPEE